MVSRLAGMVLVEAVCCSLADAKLAEQVGANRVEICVDIETAGLTPPIELVREVRSAVRLPLVVMIRARPGDYCFTGAEKAQMLSDAGRFGSIADGLIFGALTSSRELDAPFLSEMIEAAGTAECVIHRSIDTVDDYFGAVEEARKLGFRRILTSGHAATAFEGRQTLREVIRRFGDQIEVLPAGGIRASNVAAIIRDSGATQVHLGPRQGPPDALDGASLKQVIVSLATS